MKTNFRLFMTNADKDLRALTCKLIEMDKVCQTQWFQNDQVLKPHYLATLNRISLTPTAGGSPDPRLLSIIILLL